MTNIKKVNFKKATITIDEEIQFAGDKKDSENDGRLNAESIVDKIITFDLNKFIYCHNLVIIYKIQS